MTMESELKNLKQKIRRLEAGGETNLALRREYNAKLQAHRHLHGGAPVEEPVERADGWR